MNDRKYLLPDDYFQDLLDQQVLPYLKERLTMKTIAGCDGKPLRARYYRQEGADCVVCISHGFTEFSERYSECIYYFLQEGYSVAIIDHRSHGYSYRPLKNLNKVHIDDYETFVEDYHCFVEQVKRDFPEQRRVLFGHSMGGCIATLYAEKYPEDFEKLVLSSPMLDINIGKIPKPAAFLFGKCMIAIGKGEMYYGPQVKEWKPDERFEDSCGTERARFLAWKKMQIKNPYYQLAGGTLGWATASLAASKKAVAEAAKVTVPALLLQAGRDHLVSPGGQETAISRMAQGRITRYPNAKHEIFNCDRASRTAFWNEIMDFLKD